MIMNELAVLSVDVVIPVYNAPELTRRCIDSVVRHLGQSIGAIYIQDDASTLETRAMLDSLRHEKIHVHHADRNQGFGKSVNDAVARSGADLVLVLNSDTEIHENFLPLLCDTFNADPQLAVISPVTDEAADYSRYLRHPGGYVATYRFQGYAFLIRRDIFLALGGFDLVYGRGYFEDTDLGRRLDQQGWRIGVQPDARIHHESGGSFGRGRSYRLLAERNRTLYLSRYPDARRNVLLISNHHTPADFPDGLADAVEQVLRQGGGVHWLTSSPLPQLSCLQMRNSPASIKTIAQLMLRGWSREDKRISEVWLLPGVSGILRTVLVLLIRLRKLEVKYWEDRVSRSDDSLPADRKNPPASAILREEASKQNME